MRKRLLKKRIAHAIAASLSLGMMLDHARASFWAIRDVGQQRRYLRFQMIRYLHVHPNHARYVTRGWRPRSLSPADDGGAR